MSEKIFLSVYRVSTITLKCFIFLGIGSWVRTFLFGFKVFFYWFHSRILSIQGFASWTGMIINRRYISRILTSTSKGFFTCLIEYKIKLIYNFKEKLNFMKSPEAAKHLIILSHETRQKLPYFSEFLKKITDWFSSE